MIADMLQIYRLEDVNTALELSDFNLAEVVNFFVYDFESILKNSIHAIAFVTIYIFIGYLLLTISKNDFYLNNFQSITQGTINLIDEMIRFWINLPNRLMKYGQ